MPSNNSKGVQNSATSSVQPKQASTPSLASVIESLQVIQTLHEEQYRKARLRDVDYYQFLDDEAIPSKAHDTLDRHYLTEIARLKDIIAIKDARIEELEAALRDHQIPTHDKTPPKQPPTDTGTKSPTPQNPTSNDSDDEKYCYCLRPSYGAMVACDNPDCTRKWFHLHHTNLPYLPEEDDDWTCTLCHGWEPLYDGCWHCPKCFYEILDEDEDYDEGVPSKYAPRGCESCKLERGDPWQLGYEDRESSGDEEDGESQDEDEESENSSEGVDDDEIEHDVDSEDAEMDYDDIEGCDEGEDDLDGESAEDDRSSSSSST